MNGAHHPAVRHEPHEPQRVPFLSTIEAQLIRAEKSFGRESYFYRVLFVLISKEVGLVRGEISHVDFPTVPPYIVAQIFQFFDHELKSPVRELEISHDERMRLFERLAMMVAEKLGYRDI